MNAVVLRAAPWRSLLGASAAAAAVASGATAAGADGAGARLMQVAIVLVGGAAACALDEPAAAVVGSCPVRPARQLLARALAAGFPLLVGLLAVLGWWLRATVDRMLLLELVGCWLLGFALATLARARLDEPAETVSSSLVLLLVTTMLVEPISRHVALFPLGDDQARGAWTWCTVIAASLIALVVALRQRRWRIR